MIDQLQACTWPTVAFSVSLNSAVECYGIITVAEHQVVKFGNTITNTYAAYNSETRVFTFRHPGLYSFCVHVMSYERTDETVCLLLQHNAVGITSLYVAYDPDSLGAASMSAVVHLTKGAEVRVFTTCASELWQFASNDFPNANIFNGVLLKSDYC